MCECVCECVVESGYTDAADSPLIYQLLLRQDVSTGNSKLGLRAACTVGISDDVRHVHRPLASRSQLLAPSQSPDILPQDSPGSPLSTLLQATALWILPVTHVQFSTELTDAGPPAPQLKPNE